MASERDSVLHSWCVQSEWQAPTVVGGRGAYLELEDGRRILDMSSLAECSNLGHQHPRVVAAIRAQAQQLCFVTSAWGARPRAELAEALLEKSGFDGGRVFFTLGGADANENAVKFARQASSKPRGRDRRARPLLPRRQLRLRWRCRAMHAHAPQVDPAAFGVLHVPPPYAYRCPFGSADALTCGDARGRGGGGDDRSARRGQRRRGADGTQRRHQRHRRAGQLLARPARGDPRARRLPDRRRSDERLRPLRRMVRLAAPWRRRQART